MRLCGTERRRRVGENRMKWPGAHNMVFTQRRGFVLGASLGLQIHSLRCRTLVCYAVDTASLATWFLFGKLFGVATLVGFGEKRCRKNLPLDAPRQ